MKEYLFSYGTLQKEKTQLELFGKLLQGEKDTLNGYKIALVKVEDESFLARGEELYQRTVIPTSNDSDKVEGIVFEISEAELLVTNVYEPNNYKKIKVKLQSGKEAWVYIAT